MDVFLSAPEQCFLLAIGYLSAVGGVPLTILAEGIQFLLGQSGCNTTTFLRLVAGFERLDGGEIRIGTDVIARTDLHVLAEQLHIGMIIQDKPIS
ncbi:MAG TPA: ATP-binding cassette domain-containing protein [candidate division Zixibacteria bacterium]|nr:ATP-binding cassette domain-containing protein [candidate division Zixibacteria bacterium]